MRSPIRDGTIKVLIGMLLSASSSFVGVLILIGILQWRQRFLLGYYCEPRFWVTNSVLLIIGFVVLFGGIRFFLTKVKGIKFINPSNIFFIAVSFVLLMLGVLLPLISIIAMTRGFLRCVLGLWGL